MPDFESMPDRECELCGSVVEARWVYPCHRVTDEEKRPIHRVCSICYHREVSISKVGDEWVPTFVAVTEEVAERYRRESFPTKPRAPKGAAPKKKPKKKTLAAKLLERD